MSLPLGLAVQLPFYFDHVLDAFNTDEQWLLMALLPKNQHPK